MIVQFGLIFLWLIVTFIVTYCSGNIFLDFLRVKRKTSFFDLFAGVILVPTLFAVFASNGLSILLGIPIIFIVYIFLLKRNNTVSIKVQLFSSIRIKELAFSMVVLSFLFLVHLTYFYDFISLQEIAIKTDYSYYARLASYLRDTGIENTSIELFLEEPNKILPYHYIEIWFAALVSKVFGIHSQHALMLCVFPILYTTVFLGGLEIVKELRSRLNQQVSGFDYVLAVLILITVSYGFLYPNFISILNSDIWALSVHGSHKLVYVYVLMIAIFILLFDKKLIEVSLMVAILVICQVNVAPAILIGFTLYLFLNLLMKKIDWKSFMQSMALPVVALIFFSLLYRFFGGTSNVSLSQGELIAQFDSIEELQTLVNIFVKTIVQIIITLLPFGLIYFIFKQKLQPIFPSRIILFSVLIVVAGLIAWGLFNQMHDSVQLWGNIYNVVVNIIIFTLLVSLIIVFHGSKWPMVLVFTITSIVFFIHKKKKIKENTHIGKGVSVLNDVISQKNPSFAYIKREEDYDKYFFKHEQVWVGQTYTLMAVYDPLKISCISNHNIPIIDEKERKFQENTTFLKYVKEKKSDGSFVNFKQTQVDFVREFDIDYLLVYNNRGLPENFNNVFNRNPLGTVDNYAIYSRKSNF